ncbi:zinc finger protein 800 [Cimex lectularius]|uniref:C2H2-type domain-containing protein n=1 Tax=Cimex lectularius TaxID=79782 RepID=A0A8I6RDD4_CIMLE|nr:zinc finger protein 800 [Cimex lectularius]XP_014241801.1 zinc finger protein 800 [Cimex lectularius]
MKGKPLRNKPNTKPMRMKKQIKAYNKKGKEKKQDVSVLHQPVDASIDSLSDIIKLFEDSSPELKKILDEECDIIYECKACRSLFRSMPNFVTHKRSYCLSKFKERMSSLNGEFKEQTLMLGKQRGSMLSTRTTLRKDILTLLDSVSSIKVDYNINGPFVVREMDKTSQSLLHSFNHEGKHPTVERSATIGPDGRFLGAKSPEPEDIKCPLCELHFDSQNALSDHSQEKHPKLKDYYVCPCCKQCFVNAWSVYRHMYKDHRKTSEEVRRLRSQIQKQHIYSEEDNTKTDDSIEETVDSDEKEMKEFEERHKCECCGRQFERKVAMLSHYTSCLRKSRSDKLDNKKRHFPSEVPSSTPSQLKIMVRTDYKKQKLSAPDNLLDNLLQPKIVLTKTDSFISPESHKQNISNNVDTQGILNKSESKLETKIRELHHIRLQLGTGNNKVQKCDRLMASNPHIINISSDEFEYDDESETAELNQKSSDKKADDSTTDDVGSILTDEYRFGSGEEEEEREGEEVLGRRENGKEIITTDNKFEPVENGGENLDHLIDKQPELVYLISDSEDDSFRVQDQRSIVEPESTINDEEESPSIVRNDISPRNTLNDTSISSTELSPVINGVEYHEVEGEEENSSSYLKDWWTIRKIDTYIDRSKKKCVICFKVFSRVQFVRRHVARHFGITNYRCKLCDLECFLRADILSHMLKAHNLKYPRNINSEYCERVFPKESSFSKFPLALDDSNDDEMPEEQQMSNGHDRDAKISSSSSLLDLDDGLCADQENEKNTKTNPYDTDLDDLVNTESPSDEKLKALMMEVIFGTKPDETGNL